MEHKKVAIILFYDKDKNILIQDRRKISKRGEEYGFFGGHIEENETPEQALLREIKEELGITLTNFKFFKKYHRTIKKFNLDVIQNVFLATMPDINNLIVKEGKLTLMKIEESFNLKMVPGDVEILKEIDKFLNN